MDKREGKREKDPTRVLQGRMRQAQRELTPLEQPWHEGDRDQYIARILAGERQTDIAKEAGVSRQRVGQWLRQVGVEKVASDLVAERLAEKEQRERTEAERRRVQREKATERRALCICRDALAGATVFELRSRYFRPEAEILQVLASAKIMPKRGRREDGRKSPYHGRSRKQRSG